MPESFPIKATRWFSSLSWSSFSDFVSKWWKKFLVALVVILVIFHLPLLVMFSWLRFFIISDRLFYFLRDRFKNGYPNLVYQQLVGPKGREMLKITSSPFTFNPFLIRNANYLGNYVYAVTGVVESFTREEDNSLEFILKVVFPSGQSAFFSGSDNSILWIRSDDLSVKINEEGEPEYDSRISESTNLVKEDEVVEITFDSPFQLKPNQSFSAENPFPIRVLFVY